MRLSTKRALDFYVGRPLLALMQGAARVLGAVLRRDHGDLPVRSILIVKFQGIGSLVLAKPALAALRREHPDARIIFWGTPAMVPLAEQMPEFDELLVLDDRSLARAVASLARSLVRLWRAPLDWAFDLEAYSRLSSVLVTFSLARNRSGFALEQLRSRRAHTHLVYFNRYRHLGEAYARLVGQLLPRDTVIDASAHGEWKFPLTPLALPALSAPYFVFNIHAGDLALERRWPRQHFQALIARLLALRPDAIAVLIGHGTSERAYTAPLADPPRILDLSGQLSLTETVRLLANADLVVSNDTAPLHLALSTSVKLVGLFGPTRAETYLPPGRPNVQHAQESLYCAPCVHHWEPSPCHGDNQCMKRLSPYTVLTRCCTLLGIPVPPPSADEGSEAIAPSSYYPGLVYRRSERQGQE